jgi:kumamolisin
MVSDAYLVGAPQPSDVIQVRVLVRSRSPDGLLALVSEKAEKAETLGTNLPREQFACNYGADPRDLACLESFAHQYGLTIEEACIARRSVLLSGPAVAIGPALGVELGIYERGAKRYLGCQGPIHLSKDVADRVVGVFGLDNRPQADAALAAREASRQVLENSATPFRSARDVADHYAFARTLRGKDQCVGILSFGGGYVGQDLKDYCERLGIPAPTVSPVSVGGGQNNPLWSRYSDTLEVSADIQVLAAVAPEARIVVYFAPNTERGWVEALGKAIHDSLRRPSVLSISWGSAESRWSSQLLSAVNQYLIEAAALGVTVCCAAGSRGSDDGWNDGIARAVFPASSPFALACGGTRMEVSPDNSIGEIVWNDSPDGGCTGGGISDIFGKPSWQTKFNIPPSANRGGRIGRGVPDVAGPAADYSVHLNGEDVVFRGTSATAALWAGFVTLLNEHFGGPVGFLHPFFYGQAAAHGAFREITKGNNGTYAACRGWNACAGLGSPHGIKLLSLLSGLRRPLVTGPSTRENITEED